MASNIIIGIVLGNLMHNALGFYGPKPACTSDPLADIGRCSEYRKPDNSKLFFKVNGTELSIELNSGSLVLECLNGTNPLDVAGLPRYEEHIECECVFIRGCWLGAAPAAAVLRALRVGVERKLALEGVHEALSASHFADLHMPVLQLTSEDSPAPLLDQHFYTELTNLSTLWTSGIRYERPPSGLKTWTYKNAKLSRLSPEADLSALKELTLVEPELRDVSALAGAVHLEVLSLGAPVRELPPLPALRSLELDGVPLAALGHYPALTTLSVRSAGAATLPPRWLAGSAQLQTLSLRFTPLRSLPSDFLQHNLALLSLSIIKADLTSDMLSDDLLRMNGNLTKLNFSHNNLTVIPSDKFFSRLEKLEELDLSYNELVTPAPGYRFPALPALLVLVLDHNPLGDACPDAGLADLPARQRSWLRALVSLQRLSLVRTRAARLCADWLRDMPQLARLDLQHNLLTELTYDDLQPVRAGRGARVNLRGNNISHVLYDQRDYERARLDTSFATVELDSLLSCDCDLYWFAAALAAYPAHADVRSPRCSDGRPLALWPAAGLACATPCGRCRCSYVPASSGFLAACDRFDELRNFTDYQRVVEISLVDAGLTSLPDEGSLPPPLRELDLRNNSIGAAPAPAARALLRRPTLRLRLSGNPLDCRCGHRDLVDELLLHKDRVIDFEQLECAEGGPPASGQCGLSSGAGALLGALAAVGAAAALALAALAHPAPRARLKTALRVLGVRLPRQRDAPARFDAFVSFAEADAQWVATALAPALERGPAARRLCLHYRDWAVGELIPRQIQWSVQESRRTLLVVSEAFARSAWARAELEAALAAWARAARPAPVLVLREQPTAAALAAAPALADYLRAATYLRADDPRFEHKLRAAVPAQR